MKYSYEEFLNDLSFSSDTLEGPTGGLMNLGLSSLAKQVKSDGYKSLLGGMGLDEFFGGYDFFMNPDASIQGKLIDNTSMSFPNKFIINEKYKADFIGQKTFVIN